MAQARPRAHEYPDLQALGVSLSDPVEKLWECFGNTMGNEYVPGLLRAGQEIKLDFGTTTVSLLRNHLISVYDIASRIEKHGGRKGWVKTLEKMLCFEFRTASVPESAVLATQAGGGRLLPRDEPVPDCTGIKVGAMLKRARQMYRLDFPVELVTVVVEDTPQPWAKNALRYDDSKRVMKEVFLWVILNFHSKRKCIIMFRYLAIRLNSIFGAISVVQFVSKLTNRWKNGLRSNASVCPSHPALHLTVPHKPTRVRHVSPYQTRLWWCGPLHKPLPYHSHPFPPLTAPSCPRRLCISSSL